MNRCFTLHSASTIIDIWPILFYLFSHPPVHPTPIISKQITDLLLFIEFSIILGFIFEISFASFTDLFFLGTFLFFAYTFILFHDSKHYVYYTSFIFCNGLSKSLLSFGIWSSVWCFSWLLIMVTYFLVCVLTLHIEINFLNFQ